MPMTFAFSICPRRAVSDDRAIALERMLRDVTHKMEVVMIAMQVYSDIQEKSEKNLLRTKNDVALKRHYNLINQAEHCVEIFFEVIGQPFEPHRRHRNHLMPRAAIGVALSTRCV